MHNHQSGVSLSGLLVVAVLLIAVSLLGLKLAPAYMEFRTIRSTVIAVAQEQRAASVTDIRRAFDRRANIDGIETITGADLEVTKEGGEVQLTFAYRKEVPLFANVGIYIEFAGGSKE
jgi:Tfp pilus assembly protein PilV